MTFARQSLDLEDSVWDGDEVTDSKLKTALSRLRQLLRKAGVPWEYSQQEGLILKKQKLPNGC